VTNSIRSIASRLARHLSRFDNWQGEADALTNQLQESVYETARTAMVNLPDGWGWFHSPITAQARMLQLFVTRNGSVQNLLKGLVDGLLDLRREGTWQTIYDNAQALTALVDYAQLLPQPPDFQATVQLAGKSLDQPSSSRDINNPVQPCQCRWPSCPPATPNWC
jgi:uncharacterized protein YfaS (alpha-2-macroglobulin family)